MVSWPKRIKLIRTLLGRDMTQEKLARTLGVHTNTVINWEAGLYEPQRRYRQKLSDLCLKNGIVFTSFGMPYEEKDTISFGT